MKVKAVEALDWLVVIGEEAVFLSTAFIFVVPTFFLLFSFTFLFEDFYYSVKEYRKISVCCSSG